MKTKVFRNIFISFGAIFAIGRVLAVDISDRVADFGSARLLAPPHTFIIFDPPGATFTLPSAITPAGVIIGSYFDAGGVSHGFLRTPGGTFTTFDPPVSASTTATSTTPSGVITGWYSDVIGNLHGFLRALDGSISSFDGPPGSNIAGSIFLPGGPPPSINPARAIAGTYLDPSFVEHGFLRTPDGSFTTIDVPGAFLTEALAINPAGVIVGDFSNAVTRFQGFLRTADGTFTLIDANAGTPTAMNPGWGDHGTFVDGTGRLSEKS